MDQQLESNVFDAIRRNGSDAGFVPQREEQFFPTDAPAGSPQKIAELRERLETGAPLWHEEDRRDYTGWQGSVRTRRRRRSRHV